MAWSLYKVYIEIIWQTRKNQVQVVILHDKYFNSGPSGFGQDIYY